MGTVRVSIVHDEAGAIISMARPAKDAKVLVLSGEGQAVLETEVDEDSVVELVSGSHRVDVEQKSVVAY
jgi:hypothetical protein